MLNLCLSDNLIRNNRCLLVLHPEQKLTHTSYVSEDLWSSYTVKMNMLYLINRIVATDYKQYY